MIETLDGMPTESATKWLQTILRERISSELKLRSAPKDSAGINKQWHLTVDGSEKLIRMPLNTAFFQPLVDGEYSDLSFESVVIDLESLNIKKKCMPAPGGANLPLIAFLHNGMGCTINYDIAGLCYWVLTRSEEYIATKRQLDNHGRFPGNISHAARHGYLERPLVDEWIALLCKIAETIWPKINLVKHRFKIEVSHDIDHISKYRLISHKQFFSALARDALKKKSLQEVLKGVSIRMGNPKILSPEDPYNCFDWLMDKSETNNLTSTFFFMAGQSNSTYDAKYQITDPIVRKILKKIHSRGHTIGLHPSYNTCDNPELLTAEATKLKRICTEEKIQQVIWGGRMHFLRWSWPSTLHGWKLSNFDYDSTLGYADNPGFRCGTCYEYPMFDPIKQEPLKTRQKPLILMECSVISQRYLNLGYSQEAYDVIDQLKQTCKDVSGTFQFLWHNSHFDSQDDRELYSFCIEDL